MTSRKQLLWLLGGTLLLGWAIYLAITYTLVKVEDPAEPTAEARAKPFLAAARLLEQHGHPVQFERAYSATPAGNGLLFLSAPGSGLTPAQALHLRNWVASGNELIVPATSTDADDKPGYDPLLASAHVHALDSANANVRKLLEMLGGNSESRLQLDGEVGQLQTSFSPFLQLRDQAGPDALRLRDEHGVHVLRFNLGLGHITVLSDNTLFSNKLIGEGDNAALLLYLADQEPGPVWFVENGRYPRLLTLLWRHAAPLMIGAGLLLALWLWLASRRFGPLLPALEPPRRRLSEHLGASGRYLWYAGQQQRLYRALRLSLRRRLLQRFPHWRALSNDEWLRALAKQSGISTDTLRRALSQAPDPDLARFLGDVRVMNQLRKLT